MVMLWWPIFFGDFDQFSARQSAICLETNVMILFVLHNRILCSTIIILFSTTIRLCLGKHPSRLESSSMSDWISNGLTKFTQICVGT
jgi:hypothetical protein